MDIYVVTLVLGAAGLALMAFSGLGGRGHAGATHAHSGAGMHRGTAHAGAHQAAHVHAHGAHTGSARGATSRAFWSVTSPRFVFSVLLGFGAAGEALRAVPSDTLRFAGAVVGAVLFERFIITPIWNVSMRFASEPAQTLESAIADEATAVTAFDHDGNGIVSLEVDGQVLQILATLQAGDRSLAVRVHAGQKVRIEDVDTARNRCTVSLI